MYICIYIYEYVYIPFIYVYIYIHSHIYLIYSYISIFICLYILIYIYIYIYMYFLCIYIYASLSLSPSLSVFSSLSLSDVFVSSSVELNPSSWRAIEILSGRVCVTDTRAQWILLHTWIILVTVKHHLVKVGWIHGPTECLSWILAAIRFNAC